MRSADTVTKLLRRRWLWLLVAVAALYVLLPQLGAFHLSWQTIRRAWGDDLWLAGLFTALTYLAAAASYVLLSFGTLSYARTVLMQLASMFANRLLPAGLGGIGANYAYLRKARHTPVQAAGLIAMNNTLGFVGHLVIVTAALAVWHSRLAPLHWSGRPGLHWPEVLVAGGAVVAVIVARHVRRRLASGIRRVFRQVLSYRRHPWRLSGALLASICLTLCNVLSFYYSVHSLGGHLPFVSVLLVFTLGVSLGTVTPTPGGLGGVEAGLVAGLIAYHLPGDQALAVVLIYRFVSYWLALLVGGAAFVTAERRKYF